jgi:hypothetical protein
MWPNNVSQRVRDEIYILSQLLLTKMEIKSGSILWNGRMKLNVLSSIQLHLEFHSKTWAFGCAYWLIAGGEAIPRPESQDIRTVPDWSIILYKESAPFLDGDIYEKQAFLNEAHCGYSVGSEQLRPSWGCQLLYLLRWNHLYPSNSLRYISH